MDSEPQQPDVRDALAGHVAPDTQREAARHAQDAFARLFRLSIDADDGATQQGVARIEAILRGWATAGNDADARSLRLALLLSGLDQWGLAYSRAFGLQAIPALTDLLGRLRNDLDVAEEARCQGFFALIDAAEANVIDFKIELRRGIHLALWHAMVAGDDRDEATRILSELGGMMLALARGMPLLGWRLVADALAHVQIRCVSAELATVPMATDMTLALFALLRQALPEADMCRIEALASQAAAAWQQARRPPH